MNIILIFIGMIFGVCVYVYFLRRYFIKLERLSIKVDALCHILKLYDYSEYGGLEGKGMFFPQFNENSLVFRLKNLLEEIEENKKTK